MIKVILPKEELYVKNFLSLHDFKFEIKQFNIITGDMSDGKSLVMKLLEFFETIFPDLFILPNRAFWDTLEIEGLYTSLAKTFNRRFRLNDTESFDINYKYTYGEVVLDIKLFRKKGSEKISIESVFLDCELEEWKRYLKRLDKDLEANMDNNYRQMLGKFALYERLSKKFNRHYPVSAIFVPATRAALALNKMGSSVNEEYFDYYLNKFNNFIDNIKRTPGHKPDESEISNILKAKMKIRENIQLISNKDGRVVEIANASSGQQEAAYILLMLSRLYNYPYRYGEIRHIFIEEPETHLFPRGQKLILEYICKVFNNNYNENKKVPNIRFFITTHSPYALNAINNMLLKGSIKKKSKKLILNDIKTKEIPPLDPENVSVLFINDEGKQESILEKNNLISAIEIDKITADIGNDYNALCNLNAKSSNDK